MHSALSTDTEPPATPPSGSQPASPTAEPSYTHRGNGKVARLPSTLRDQVGLMLLDGVPYAEIINRIGEPAKDITENNIGNWKAASFKKWLADYERKEALQDTREVALALIEKNASLPVQDAGRTIAAAQLYELLLSFDPAAFADALADKPELYLRLINTLSRLSEGEATCAHQRAQDTLIGAKLNFPLSDNDKKLVSAETLKAIARQIKLL